MNKNNNPQPSPEQLKAIAHQQRVINDFRGALNILMQAPSVIVQTTNGETISGKLAICLNEWLVLTMLEGDPHFININTVCAMKPGKISLSLAH